MIVVKKWVAAGSTATLLAGGLFLGAPLASAAPGDAACLQASTQFNAALGAAGVDVGFVNQFEAATAAVVIAAENLALLTEAAENSEAAQAADAELVRLDGVYAVAETAVTTATAELVAAEAAVLEADPKADPDADPTVVAAQQALIGAQRALDAAGEAYNVEVDRYDALVYTAEVKTAEAVLDEAFGAVDALALQISGDEALAAELLALFKAFLAACDASAIGVDPVTPVVVPVPVTPAPTVAPVTPVAPVTVAPAPTGTNKGLNVQTAVPVKDDSPAVALIAALLAVGVAVPVATATRMRRLERAQR